MTDKSVDADLDAAFEESIKPEVEESTVQPEKAEAVEQVEAVEPEQPEPPQIPEELQPVSAWKEEARQAWESFAANQDYHDSLRALKAQFDGDYQYRTQLEQQRAELEQRARVAQQWDQLTQQYGDVLQGRNPFDVASQLFYYSQQLARDPAGTLQALAKDYGVDLNQVVQDQPYIDEHTQALQRELSELRNQIYGQQQQGLEAQQRQIVESARAFEFETDAEGNLLHPFVNAQAHPQLADQVASDMLTMLNSGYANSFQDAYDKACWANPTVRAELQKAEGQSKKLQQQEQAKKARAAATAQPRPGKSSKGQPAGVEDLDDALDMVLAEARA